MLVLFLRYWRPKATMPAPLGVVGGVVVASWCLPSCRGVGETDWTLSAPQIAAASVTGPRTWALVGMAPSGTGWRGEWWRTSPRLRAFASRAVIECRPKVDSISFSVDVCSYGPWWTTWADARLETTIAGTRKLKVIRIYFGR